MPLCPDPLPMLRERAHRGCALSLSPSCPQRRVILYGAMGYVVSPTTYRHMARGLPRPTAAQCTRFLQYVAAAHPWPMYVPADGGVPFTLFLNPLAGHTPQ